MINDEKLINMVLDFKCAESSNTFEEMLEKVDNNNRLYKEILKNSKKKYNR